MKRIEPIQLPSEWHIGDGIREDIPTFFRSAFKLDLPISGGWGYSESDPLKIHKTDVAPVNDYHTVEQVFVEKRIFSECIIFRDRFNKFSGMQWNLQHQSLINAGDRKLDRLEFAVTMLGDADWEFLKKDWEANDAYSRDPAGKAEHLAEREKRTVTYDSVYFFDVTDFL